MVFETKMLRKLIVPGLKGQ